MVLVSTARFGVDRYLDFSSLPMDFHLPHRPPTGPVRSLEGQNCYKQAVANFTLFVLDPRWPPPNPHSPPMRSCCGHPCLGWDKSGISRLLRWNYVRILQCYESLHLWNRCRKLGYMPDCIRKAAILNGRLDLQNYISIAIYALCECEFFIVYEKVITQQSNYLISS